VGRGVVAYISWIVRVEEFMTSEDGLKSLVILGQQFCFLQTYDIVFLRKTTDDFVDVVLIVGVLR
jgi:hypothetical protein